jgi:hypothetical protein
MQHRQHYLRSDSSCYGVHDLIPSRALWINKIEDDKINTLSGNVSIAISYLNLKWK